MEITHPDVSVRDLDQLYLKKCFTDAHSLEQTLNKDAGQPQDKRGKALPQGRQTSASRGWVKIQWHVSCAVSRLRSSGCIRLTLQGALLR